MASEERFSRKKNHSGFPERAVRWLLEQYGIDPRTIDRVAVAGLVTPMEEGGWREGPWEAVASSLSQFVPAQLLTSEKLVGPYVWARKSLRSPQKQVARWFAPYGVSTSRIALVEHHTCHAHAAYWLDPNRNDRDTLVVTLDSTGDGLCGSVSVATGGGDIVRLKAHPTLRSIGMVYTAVTRHLGMKAVEDEYKVMGLAPYGVGARAREVQEILRGHLHLSADGLDFVSRTGLGQTALVHRLRRDLAGYRFDQVASGVQAFLEELVMAHLKAWSRKTGIRKLAVGGGVFMNVKLNMLVNESAEFDEVFFLPSCGDESNAVGAALSCASDMCRTAGRRFNPEPLSRLYLGPSHSAREVEAALEPGAGRLKWRRCQDIERQTAELVADYCVVGRVSGAMEFGARALGNRSILARADDLRLVHRINAAIKKRDFWMPFAPAILWEQRARYVINPKDTPAPYMNLAFRSTPLARRDLAATLHPADHSCRPQIVTRDANPGFHRMLQCYAEITGCGGLLNTSFNLHGEPIVCSPADAIDTYVRSGLDVLTIGDYLIWDPQRMPELEAPAKAVVQAFRRRTSDRVGPESVRM
jgi:carbamoyltransferase